MNILLIIGGILLAVNCTAAFTKLTESKKEEDTKHIFALFLASVVTAAFEFVIGLLKIFAVI